MYCGGQGRVARLSILSRNRGVAHIVDLREQGEGCG